MTVRFTKSPTGRFNLAYSIGDEASISDSELVKSLLEEGYAVAVTEAPEKETATAKTPAKETRKK